MSVLHFPHGLFEDQTKVAEKLVKQDAANTICSLDSRCTYCHKPMSLVPDQDTACGKENTYHP